MVGMCQGCQHYVPEIGYTYFGFIRVQTVGVCSVPQMIPDPYSLGFPLNARFGLRIPFSDADLSILKSTSLLKLAPCALCIKDFHVQAFP